MASAYTVARLRRAMLHFVGGRALQALIRIALVLLVVRLLPPADYGAYMLLIGVSEMLPQLCFGLLPVGQRFLPQLVDSGSRRDRYRFLFGLGLLQLLALLLIAGLFWWFWGDLLPHMSFSAGQIDATRWAPLLFLLVPSFRLVTELLQSLLEQGKAQAATLLLLMLRIGALATLLALGLGIDLPGIILLDTLATLVCLSVGWALLVGSVRRLPEPAEPQPMPLDDMARHAWHMAAVQLMGSTHSPGAMRMVIANSLGIVESGLFAFLQSLQRLVGRYLPGDLLRGLVRPMLISRGRGDGGVDRLENGMGLLFKSNLMLVLAAAMVALIAGDPLVAIASGGRFQQAGDSLFLIFMVLAFTSQRMVIDMLLQILDLTRVLRAASTLLPFTLVLAWFGARWGLNTAIAASALGIALANLFCLWRLRVHTGRFGIDWWGTGGLVVTAALSTLAGLVVHDFFGPWVAVVVAGLLLAGLLFAAKPFASGELQMVDRVLGGLARRVMQPFARKVPA